MKACQKLHLLATLGLLLAAGTAAPCVAQSAPSAPAAAAPDPDPEKLAIAQDIIRRGFPPESRQATLSRAAGAMMAQMREAVFPPSAQTDPEIRRIIERYLERLRAVSDETNRDGAPAIFEAMARAYARQFSRDDLVQIRAFVSTPAGANYLQRSMDLLSDPDIAAANRAHFARSYAAIQPLIEQARREMMDYMAAKQRPRR
jgi:hypothetical protein